MQTTALTARMHGFPLPEGTAMDASLAIPAVRGTWNLKYGQHAYSFLNLRSGMGVRTLIGHGAIIGPGLKRFEEAANGNGRPLSWWRCLTPRYHYGFSLLEQVMLMTVPHTVTPVGNGRFIVNLWSWFGYLLVDTATKTVACHTMEDGDRDSVLGSQQWHDPDTGTLTAMSYSLGDSLARLDDPTRPVSMRIFRHRLGEEGSETVWQGELADYVHDLLVDKARRYCVVCELGMHLDGDANILPSKVLILDLSSGKEWVLERFVVAAHACFDPENPNIIYFSNHNFEFRHSSLVQLLKKGSYSVRFRGPASIFKYELTPDGPREIGVFTREDFHRLTNMHVFRHRRRRIIAAMGFPDEIFILDAGDMSFIRKIHVTDPRAAGRSRTHRPALVGTVAPSPDGERLFVHTTRSLQVLDLYGGDARCLHVCARHHACFNHMAAIPDTGWGPERGAGQ